MRLVLQRVQRAQVTVDDEVVGSIGPGAVVLVAAAKGDTEHDARYLARKTAQLRIFDDEEGRLNATIERVAGSYLVVSQFTLYGDCRKGNRPSYLEAAPPEEGEQGYESFARELEGLGHRVERGRFRAAMQVELVNDGPVTLILESTGRAAS